MIVDPDALIGQLVCKDRLNRVPVVEEDTRLKRRRLISEVVPSDVVEVVDAGLPTPITEDGDLPVLEHQSIARAEPIDSTCPYDGSVVVDVGKRVDNFAVDDLDQQPVVVEENAV